MNHRPAIALLILTLTACTATDEIIVDRKGIDPARYQQDLAQCREYATEVKTGEKVVRGTVSGAVIGGLAGAAVGNSDTAQRGAGVGAVGGGAKGAARGEREELQVVKNCLRGRGYRVLN